MLDFGAGDIGGEVIFGLVQDKCKDADIDMLQITRMEHAYKMPKNRVVIFYNSFEDRLYCLDASKMQENECPVVRVSKNYAKIETVAESFGKFFYQLLQQED